MSGANKQFNLLETERILDRASDWQMKRCLARAEGASIEAQSPDVLETRCKLG